MDTSDFSIFPSGRFFPGGQPHVRFGAVSPLYDQFGSGVAMNGEMKLVLHLGKKALVVGASLL